MISCDEELIFAKESGLPFTTDGNDRDWDDPERSPETERRLCATESGRDGINGGNDDEDDLEEAAADKRAWA